MTAPTANLINAIALIVLSVWGFAEIALSSWTALIPAAAGVILVLCQPGVRAENKFVAHVAVLVTVAILLALIVPLSSALGNVYEAPLALARTVIMMGTCLLAMVAFIRSFIAARKARSGG
ncbi:MAG: hypothetical protein AAGA28_17500 [Pseudomonadota bacterium]